MTEQRVNIGTRLGAMILDHIIITLIIMIFATPTFITTFSRAFEITREQNDSDILGKTSFLLLIGISLYFCKDCFLGRSPAKRILKLQVVDNNSGQVASPIKCFIRDIFCILWPVEVVIALVNPNRRIGDFIAGTKLIPYELPTEKRDPKYIQILFSIVLSVCLVYIIMLPFKDLNSTNKKNSSIFEENSYNQVDSKLIESLLQDSLGTIITPNVKIFDKVKNDSVKYISVIALLKENSFLNESDFENIKSKAISLLYKNFNDGPFKSQIKFIYQEPGLTKAQTVSFDTRQAIKK